MTFGFAILVAGILFLLSGKNNVSLAEAFKGTLSGGEGAGERGFKSVLASIGTGAQNAVSKTGGEGLPEGLGPVKPTAAMAKAVAAATMMHGRYPYSWGGGHAGCCKPGGEGENGGPGYDCSGAVSCVLCKAGLLSSPLTSGGLMSWGEAGPGKWITVYANPEHTFMKIGNLWFGTGSTKEAKRGGPAWGNHDPDLGAYTARHPKGY